MDTREILRDYVSDMLGVEKHCLEAVKRQTGDERLAAYPEAHDLLTRIEAVLRTHTGSLDQVLSMLDGQTESVVTKAVTSAIDAVAGIYGKFRPEEPVSRSLGDHYTTLNLAAINYTMLHTTADALHEQGVAELALKNLNELTPLIVELTRVIPGVVTRELSEEGKVIDPSLWREATTRTQKAWSPKVVGTYH